VVECSFAWLNRNRRLAKDVEAIIKTSGSWVKTFRFQTHGDDQSSDAQFMVFLAVAEPANRPLNPDNTTLPVHASQTNTRLWPWRGESPVPTPECANDAR
jgi:hypothetical protein